MGLFKCIAGHLAACHGSSEKIKGSVFSNRGAIVSIMLKTNAGSISTGTGILIHRALILTTHGTLPSISAAQESDILISQKGVGDLEEYGRKLAPERFFITSSVLDLTVVACDPTGTEVAQPLCLHNSLAPCLDFGSTVYLLGRQQIEEHGKDVEVGDGKIIVETDTLIKFSTDGSNWSPGSAGFDIYGNLAFMICDPKKLVSTMSSPQRKRPAATAFWRKDTPKQFGIPVPIVRHWLSENWEGSIEELDRPRVPARLKVSQKEQSAESSGSSVKFKRAPKQKEQNTESSTLEKCKSPQKQNEGEEEVSSFPVGPENEILDRSSIVAVVEVQEIQTEKKNDSSSPAVPHNLDVSRSRTPEEKGSISNVDRTNYQIQGEFQGKINSPAQQKEQHLDKASISFNDQDGPQEEQHLDKLIIVTQKEQDAEHTSIAAHSKGPPEEERQDLFGTEMAHKESITPHQIEFQKVIILAPQIEIQNERQHKAICKEIIPAQPIEVPDKNQQHLDIDLPKMVCKETFPVQPTEVPKENQQHLDINFPKAVSKETIPSLPTETLEESQQYLDINFAKAVCKEALPAQPTEIPKESQQYLDINSPKVVCKETLPTQPTEIPKVNQQLSETNFPKAACKETAPTQPIVNLMAKKQLLDINFPLKHKKEREEQAVLLQFKEPRSSICRELRDIEESKQAKENSSSMEEVLKRSKAEHKEPLFSGEHEKCTGKSMTSSEVKGPKMSIHLRLKDLDEKKQAQEDTLSAQEIWKTPIDICTESKFAHQRDRDPEKSVILEKSKAPISTIPIELQQPEEKKQIEEEHNSQKIGKGAKAECTEYNFLSLNKKHRDKFAKQCKQPISSIHIDFRHTEEKKAIQREPSCLQEAWKRPIVECMESNVPPQNEKDTDQSMGLAQFKDPMSRSIRIEFKPTEGKKQMQVGPSSTQGLWKRPKGERAGSQFPVANEIHREKSLSSAHLKESVSGIPVEVKHMVKMEQVQEDPLRFPEVEESPKAVYDASKTKEGTVAELKAKEDCFEDGLLQDLATQQSQNSLLSQASSLKDTDSSDVETMYSAETRESRNYSPRESDGKRKLQQAQRSQSSTSSRGVRNWNINARYSLQGRPRSALPMYSNQVHHSCTRKISLQMPSYKCPDYFGPTVSSIMKKRNPDLSNNSKAAVVQLSPRWIF